MQDAKKLLSMAMAMQRESASCVLSAEVLSTSVTRILQYWQAASLAFRIM